MTQLEQTVLPVVSRWRNILDLVTTLAMLAAAVTIVSSRVVRVPSAASKFTLPKSPVSLEGAALRGNPRATVGILEFSDFECPYCSKFARENMPAVKERLIDTGRVLFAFRNLPLSIHSGARRKAEWVVCAGEQDKFWQAHDALFQLGKAESLVSSDGMGSLGLEAKRFEACMSDRAPAIVDRDLAQANELGIAGTPFFLVGLVKTDGRLDVKDVIRGASAAAEFEAAVKKLVNPGKPSS
jgi:protein-disulfide isomerase